MNIVSYTLFWEETAITKWTTAWEQG